MKFTKEQILHKVKEILNDFDLILNEEDLKLIYSKNKLEMKIMKKNLLMYGHFQLKKNKFLSL
ncbi:hypothetical protein [Aureivirga sp. CE67]|uniref:hypothetical protein n=1 Tax=Aureivirga sp. CE67 TaxID=1788983 RepID=UPI0018CBD6F3|nr:hypothetical protein [Aureivirga sp. CE67]